MLAEYAQRSEHSSALLNMVGQSDVVVVLVYVLIGILAFAVIFVVVIFVYMSMRLQREKQEERHFIESYTISLVKGFAGDSISLFVNDSLISNKTMSEEPYTVEIGRFAEQSALLIVDNNTELVSTFDLSEKGGTYQFEKESDGIKQLAK